MRANRSRDTGPEIALRAALHRRGLRYRVHYPIVLPDGRRVRPDIVFSKARLAVFIDGCYWHGCPQHGSVPVRNRQFWAEKLRRNRARDAQQMAGLAATGWSGMRIWEHELLGEGLNAIAACVEEAWRWKVGA